MTNDPRETKLPMWARDLLNDERKRTRRAESKLQAHLETVEKSRIWFGNYDNPVYIPEKNGYQYQTVYFQVEGDRISEAIRVRIKTDHQGRTGLEVNGGDSVNIELDASNLFRVYLRP